MEGWYYAASDSAYKPYGDAQMLDWDEDGWKPYCSIDSSEVLVFSYNDGWYCSYMGALPANVWASLLSQCCIITMNRKYQVLLSV